jgi:hypothetical protein
MTVAEAIQRTNVLYSGEATEPDEDIEAAILLYLNIFQERWCREPGIDWNSLRVLTDIGNVTATNRFPLEGVVKLSRQEGDYVIITHTDDTQSIYTIVTPTVLHTTSRDNVCTVFGRDLVFPTAFTSSSLQYGGTVTVPAYTNLEPLVNDGSDTEILVDDPDWLCYMAAAELAAQDVTKADQAPRMLAYATDAMNAMKENNESQVDEMYQDYNPMGHVTDSLYD